MQVGTWACRACQTTNPFDASRCVYCNKPREAETTSVARIVLLIAIIGVSLLVVLMIVRNA